MVTMVLWYIKLLTKNPPTLCIQTPPKLSGADSKLICHLDPLIPKFSYVVWLFDSCSLLWDMVLNVRGLKECTSSEKGLFLALLGNPSSNNSLSLLYKDEQSCPWPLVLYKDSPFIAWFFLPQKYCAVWSFSSQCLHHSFVSLPLNATFKCFNST